MRGLVAAVSLLAALAGTAVAQAGTVSRAGEVVRYEAAPGEVNRIFAISDPGGLRVIDTGATVTASTGCVLVTATEAFCTFNYPSGLSVEVVAGDQDDYVDLRAVRVQNLCQLFGGDGADTLIGNRAGTTRYDGGPGADIFSGRGTVDYSARTNPVRVTIGDGLANDGEAGEGDKVPDEITSVWGGAASDTIKALDSPGVGRPGLVGGDGDDRLIARNPRGAILGGGAGNDELRVDGIDGIGRGGGGQDLLIGGHGTQYLGGGPGADLVVGRAGDDVLRGGRRNDTFSPGAGKDSVSAGSGDDTIFAKDGRRDHVRGGKGTDSARVDQGLDRLWSIEELL